MVTTMKNLPLSLLVLICILFAVTTTATAQVTPEQARNFQIDATHTGATTSPSLMPPLKQKWVVNFGQDYKMEQDLHVNPVF